MKPTFRVLLIIFISLCVMCSKHGEKKKKITYPHTPKSKAADNLHGVDIVDNYRWLEDNKDPKVQAWDNQQNKLTRGILDSLPQRQWLMDRFTYFTRYDEEFNPIKARRGERVFIYSKKKNQDQWVTWTKENENAEKVELLNPNKWGGHIDFWGDMPSWEGKYLAYLIGEGGKENAVIHVMEVATKKVLPDTCRGSNHMWGAWLPDSSGFYYTANPKKGEVPPGEEYLWPCVYFHMLGTSASEDKKIFYHPTEKTHSHFVEITSSGKYLLFSRGYYLMEKNEVFFKRVDAGIDAPLIPLVTGFDASYHVVEVVDKFFIHTDLKAPLGRLLVVDTKQPQRENWQEFIPESADKLQRFSVVGGRIYVGYLHNAYTQIKIYDMQGKFLRTLPTPRSGLVGTQRAGGKWDKPGVRVSFTSYTYPWTSFTYDFAANKLHFKERRFPYKVDTDNYITRQVWVTSKDGTPVSMFLAHRRGIKQDGSHPALIYGYGGFNKSRTPVFMPMFFIWLEAGGMLAVPNLRGGGEYGRKWYEAGIRENKQNSFDDCIAAAEWLIENKYTNPRKLALYGASNGGLMASAVAVQRPELFKAVWAEVPFTDMIRYHKFGRAKAWTNEYGNPDNPEHFKYLLKYSPYHNVKANNCYPAMFITGGENDPKIYPFHARKLAARMQEANTSDNPILLKIQKNAGHDGGLSDTQQILRKVDGWVFLMHQLEMTGPHGMGDR
ncbi:MAG: S9 family peptidase [Candidatus Aminicenantes bacterium]|nr:MAG: S9 family peptidase [Candidatus Aminicenantes bacterium]